MAPNVFNRKSGAVFLDRDGVILELVDYLHRIEDMRLMEGIGEAIRKLNQAGRPTMVITNQSAVARGYLSETELCALHDIMQKCLAKFGARLDAIYYCPHHPEHGEPPYKTKCQCRKPAPGLLLRAAEELGVDLSTSTFIGDTLNDLIAARRAGVGYKILVRTGYGISEEKKIVPGPDAPDAVFPDAPSAIESLLSLVS